MGQAQGRRVVQQLIHGAWQKGNMRERSGIKSKKNMKYWRPVISISDCCFSGNARPGQVDRLGRHEA